MVIWEVIVCLQRVGCVRMEGKTVFAGAVEILENMDSCFVMLVTWKLHVRRKKCEDRGNVWTGIRCKPINGTNNTLVNLSTTRQIWVIWIGGRDGINW